MQPSNQKVADGTAGVGILLLLAGTAALATGGPWSIAILTGVVMVFAGLMVRLSTKSIG